MLPLADDLLSRDVAPAFAAAECVVFDAVDPELLRFCETLLLATLRMQPVAASAQTQLQQAVADLCEQFAVDVSSVSDAQVDALRAFMDDEQIYLLVNALYLLDMRIRLQLVAPEVLG